MTNKLFKSVEFLTIAKLTNLLHSVKILNDYISLGPVPYKSIEDTSDLRLLRIKSDVSSKKS